MAALPAAAIGLETTGGAAPHGVHAVHLRAAPLTFHRVVVGLIGKRPQRGHDGRDTGLDLGLLHPGILTQVRLGRVVPRPRRPAPVCLDSTVDRRHERLVMATLDQRRYRRRLRTGFVGDNPREQCATRAVVATNDTLNENKTGQPNVLSS